MNIGAIRTALKTLLDAQLAGTSPLANVYDYPPDSPELNAILILPRSTDGGGYVGTHGTFGPGALCDIGFTIEVRVGGGQIDAAKLIDKYLSIGTDESIVDAIEADTTLGGLVQNVFIDPGSVPAWFTPASETDARTWLSSSFSLIVRTRRA